VVTRPDDLAFVDAALDTAALGVLAPPEPGTRDPTQCDPLDWYVVGVKSYRLVDGLVGARQRC
jgi:hypothetical protein